jgi:hypothetical protein
LVSTLLTIAILETLCNRYSNQVVATLRDSTRHRLAKYLDNVSFEVASYLDPRFKASFLTRDGREKIDSLLPTAHTTEASTDVEPRNKRPRFFTLLNETPCALTATDNKHSEVALYESEDLLTEPSCPLQYCWLTAVGFRPWLSWPWCTCPSLPVVLSLSDYLVWLARFFELTGAD